CKVGGIARPDEKSTHWLVSSNIFGGNRAVVGPISSKSPLKWVHHQITPLFIHTFVGRTTFCVGNYCKVGGIARPDEKSTHWPDFL
ncbi:MAG: hypothetical protein LBT97_01235, partial [Planctomycetota bacterium]|nr:hypothetical protein [Planctomycetota bacterium]